MLKKTYPKLFDKDSRLHNGCVISKKECDEIQSKKKTRLSKWKKVMCKECGFVIKFECHWCGTKMDSNPKVWGEEICGRCSNATCSRECFKDCV